MTLSNRPKKSKYQVGDIVYFLDGMKGDSANVIKVVSSVSNPSDDSTGVQENIYYLQGNTKGFKESELFHSMNALMFEIKGDYLNNIITLVAESGNNDMNGADFSYSNFEDSILIACNFINCNFEGTKLANVNFSGTNLSGAFFRNTILTNSYFADAILSNTDCTGANLTNATLPSGANTKSTFKSVVGAGHWDPETTIWVDGNPIG